MKADLLEQIKGIVLAPEAEKPERIRLFQERVWNSPLPGMPPEVANVFRELAYDLDFFVEDRSARVEDASYYGWQRLQEELQTALTKLKDLGEVSGAG